ncbi:MAG: class I SAM-dependent methyltransferase [Dehalococcoidia bacterium]|nr:class I SAM-dependent methyltransferase [Dehalococcoidia bacterium]
MPTPTLAMPTLPFAQADRAVLDFLQTVKALEHPVRDVWMREEFERRVAARGAAPQTLDEADAVMRESVAWRFDRALWRFGQELMYGRIAEALEPRRDELLAFLDTPTPNPLGTVRVDPNLPIPSYFEVDFHVQPGGMHRERMIPFITAVSNDVFSGGSNTRFEWQRYAATAVPNGPWKRILDLGCGFKSTFQFKEWYPDAEVYGIDLSAPLIKYAHKLAESMGLSIHFSQQNAERTDFPDNFFDVVFSCMLFHEVPDAAAENIIRESYRILKPGGWFVMDDTETYDRLDTFKAFHSDWMYLHNCEPYWREACLRDYPAMLRAAGFRNVYDHRTGENAGDARVGARINKGQK